MDQSGSKTQPPVADGWFRHPRGLMTMFFTEMWERFSYYGMRAILVLYISASPEAGGFGWSDKLGGLIYGIYTGSVYILSLLGGWVADRFIGQRMAVVYGGLSIMCGHISLAFPSSTAFYLGLVLIAIGTGFLKPNVATMVGQLYADGDERRDAGFSIYYMGINVGAGIGPLFVGFFAQEEIFKTWLKAAGIDPNTAWHFGFGCAAIGMLFGVIQFWLGTRKLPIGREPKAFQDANDAARSRRLLGIIVGCMVGVPLLIFATAATGVVVYTTDRILIGTTAVVLLVAAGFFFAMFRFSQWTPTEKKRIVAIFAIFLGAVFFFSVFEQAGSTFTVFADRYTDNSVLGWTFPSSYWQSVNSGFIIAFAPVFAAVWMFLGKRGMNPSWPVKFGIGLLFVAAGCLIMLPGAYIQVAGGKAGPHFLLLLYFLHTCGELCLSPVGLSATRMVAPKQIAGLAMGVFYMGIGIGNYFAGMFLSMTESWSLPTLFVMMAVAPILGGIVFLLLRKPLNYLSEST